MAERTGWGRWLENALKERGLKASDLATQAKLSRSTISQLMAGSIKSVSPRLREQIAVALRIATDEVPLPGDFSEKSQSFSGSRALPPPSYFAPGDEPPKTVLRFIDHGIPDHLLPRLAWAKGFFEPFNISLAVEKRDQREYPGDQQLALKNSFSQAPTLVSGPDSIFCDELDLDALSNASFVARVNKYHGYALITRSDIPLTPVSAPRPDDKVREFLNLMDAIATRGARNNAAFVDPPAERFYNILWKLYSDLEDLPEAEGQSAWGGLNSEYPPQEERDPNVSAIEESREYKLTVLERLHEIGIHRADFAVGAADVVARAYCSGAHSLSSDRYKVLVTYSDVTDIVNDLHLSPKFMRRLVRRSWPHPRPDSAKSPVATVNSIPQREDKAPSQQNTAYAEFREYYTAELEGLQLNNVWVLNRPLDNAPDCRPFLCRVAGVAFRTVELLRDPDPQQLSSSLEQLMFQPPSLRPRDTASSNTFDAYQELAMPDFVKVWRDSYTFESYEETYAWLSQEGEIGVQKPIRDSLLTVMRWMEEERKTANAIIKDLERLQALPLAAEEHLNRAKHHYSIFSYWDAARNAEKARKIVEEGSRGTTGEFDG